MASLSDILKNVKSKLSDQEGWFRAGQFTPVTQITGKPLSQQGKLISPIPTAQEMGQITPPISVNQPYTVPSIERAKPTLVTQAAQTLQDKIQKLKDYGNLVQQTPTYKTLAIVPEGIKQRATDIAKLGTGYGKMISTSLDLNRIQKDQQRQEEETNKTFELVRTLRAQGRNDEANRLVKQWGNMTTQETDRINKELKQIDQTAEQGKKEVYRGAISTGETALSLYAGLPSVAANAGIGGILSAGLAKLSGDDPYKAAAEGVNDAIGYTGITRLITNPIITKILKTKGIGIQKIDKVISAVNKNPVLNQLTQRVAGGFGNVVEDRLINALDNKENKDLQSFFIGAAITGNEGAEKKAKKLLDKYVFSEKAPKASKFFGNQYVKFSKEYNKAIDTITKPVQYIGGGTGDVRIIRDIGGETKLQFGKQEYNAPKSTAGITQEELLQGMREGRAELWKDDAGILRGSAPNEVKYKMPSQNQQALAGAMFGFEPYQDENGKWQVRYSPEKGAMGVAIAAGVKTKTGKNILEKAKLPEVKIGEPPKGTKSIADIFAQREAAGMIGQGYKVQGQNVNFDKLVSEGWKPEQIDYAVKLANQSGAVIDNADSYLRGIMKQQYPQQAARMGKVQVPLSPEPAPPELARMDARATQAYPEIEIGKIQETKPEVLQPRRLDDIASDLEEATRTLNQVKAEVEARNLPNGNELIKQADDELKRLTREFQKHPEATFNEDGLPKFLDRQAKYQDNRKLVEAGLSPEEIKWMPETQKKKVLEDVTKRPVSEILEPKTTIDRTKPVVEQIDEMANVSPLKQTVLGSDAEKAYTNLEANGHAIVDNISDGLRKNKVTEDQFVRYVENPQSAPPEVRPFIDQHRKLMETSWNLRENPNLGVIDNYYPRMSEVGLSMPKELQQFGDNLWISQFTKELGTAEKRTGALTDYSMDYNNVMKNYMSQTAWEKYGKRIGMDAKTADFVNKVDAHLNPTKADGTPVRTDGTYEEPNSKFDYVEEAAIKNKVKSKKTLFSNATILDTFDNLRRKFTKEKGSQLLVKSMEDVRDVKDKTATLLSELSGKSTKQQIEILNNRLNFIRNYDNLKESLLRLTNNGKNPIPDSVIGNLIAQERDYVTQKFIDIVSQYKFSPETKSYLNREIDRLVKSSKYEQTLIQKAVNLVTGAFYRAQIWGNINTGVAQKMESVRLLGLYSPETIKEGTKQRIADLKTGNDILKRYNFDTLTADASKQLDAIEVKPRGIKQTVSDVVKNTDEAAGKVGNLFVNIGENSKNRDFLYTAEAQGKKMGLSGDDLYRFVRNELFANGFILHEFNTPKMMSNPLVRLALQYQQYNIKTINRALELFNDKEYAKSGGIIASQAASLALLYAVTGKSMEKLNERLGFSLGPALQIPYQIGKYIYDNYQKEEANRQPVGQYVKETTARSVIPFANQYMKTTGAADVLSKGYKESAKGNIRYVTGSETPIELAQALAFGQTSLPAYKKEEQMWKNVSKTGIYPTMTAEQSAVFKQLPKEEQKAAYDQFIKQQTPYKEILKQETAKPNLIESIFKKKPTEEKVSAFTVPSDTATQAEKSKFSGTVKYAIDNDKADVIPDQALRAYFYGDIEKMPSDTASEKQNKVIEQYKKLDKIYSSDVYSEDLKKRIIDLSGINKQDLEYYNMAKDDSTVKAIRQEELASTISKDAWFEQLQVGRRLIGNKQIVDNGTLDQLYERGALSDAERDYLKAIKYDPATEKYYLDRDYKQKLSNASKTATKKQWTDYKALLNKLDIGTNQSADSLKKSISSYLSKSTTKATSKVSPTIGSILSGKTQTTPNIKTSSNIKTVKRKYFR